MARNQVNEAVLLRTSTAGDLVCGGGYITVAGLTPTWKKLVSSIKYVRYRAEVSQVVTIGGVDTAWTPVGSVTYGVSIGDPRREIAGAQSILKKYAYTTSATLTKEGTTAALRREYINAQIVAKINADKTSHVTAVSLGSGNGFTITDASGYNPALQDDANLQYAQGQSNYMGKSTVQIWQETDGQGYATTNIAVTTAAVYSFGVGADLANGKPVMDFMYGNLIQGTLIAPPLTTAGLGAVSGQKYDAFVIISFKLAAVHEQRQGQQALQIRNQTIWVDNGAGSDTTNASGFLAFQKRMFRQIAQIYSGDINSFAEFFDNRPVFSGIGTAGIPTGSDGDINQLITVNNSWPYYIKGASTQIFPLWDTTNGSGIIWDLDNAAEGLEIATQPLGTSGQDFVIGKQTFSLFYKGTITDVSQANPFYVGFRKKVAFNTVISGYSDYAALGFNASAATQTINIMTNLASAGEVSTSTTKTWADTASHVFELRVDINGLVKFLVDGVDVSSVQASAYSFTSGLTIVPWVRAIGTGGGAPTNTGNIWMVIGDNTWIS